MAAIGKKVIEETGFMLMGHLNDYQDKIDTAYHDCDDDLTVTLKAKYSPAGSAVNIDTSISFVAEKVTAKASRVVDEKQMSLLE